MLYKAITPVTFTAHIGIASWAVSQDMNIHMVSYKASFHITEHLFLTWISQTYKQTNGNQAQSSQSSRLLEDLFKLDH